MDMNNEFKSYGEKTDNFFDSMFSAIISAIVDTYRFIIFGERVEDRVKEEEPASDSDTDEEKSNLSLAKYANAVANGVPLDRYVSDKEKEKIRAKMIELWGRETGQHLFETGRFPDNQTRSTKTF